jgi:hypothetical protein
VSIECVAAGAPGLVDVPAISLVVSDALSEALLFDNLDNKAVASATNRVSMVDAVNSWIRSGSGVPFGLKLKWSASANAPPTTDPSRKERGPDGFFIRFPNV